MLSKLASGGTVIRGLLRSEKEQQRRNVGKHGEHSLHSKVQAGWAAKQDPVSIKQPIVLFAKPVGQLSK